MSSALGSGAAFRGPSAAEYRKELEARVLRALIARRAPRSLETLMREIGERDRQKTLDVLVSLRSAAKAKSVEAGGGLLWALSDATVVEKPPPVRHPTLLDRKAARDHGSREPRTPRNESPRVASNFARETDARLFAEGLLRAAGLAQAGWAAALGEETVHSLYDKTVTISRALVVDGDLREWQTAVSTEVRSVEVELYANALLSRRRGDLGREWMALVMDLADDESVVDVAEKTIVFATFLGVNNPPDYWHERVQEEVEHAVRGAREAVLLEDTLHHARELMAPLGWTARIVNRSPRQPEDEAPIVSQPDWSGKSLRLFRDAILSVDQGRLATDLGARPAEIAARAAEDARLAVLERALNSRGEYQLAALRDAGWRYEIRGTPSSADWARKVIVVGREAALGAALLPELRHQQAHVLVGPNARHGPEFAALAATMRAAPGCGRRNWPDVPGLLHPWRAAAARDTRAAV